MEAVAREWFEAYASGGLAAGEQPGREAASSRVEDVGLQADAKTSIDRVSAPRPAPAASPSFKPDPKVKK